MLMVLVASTRPGRVGLPIGEWFHGLAVRHGGFDAELVDLAAINLPLLDEPAHPRLRQYTHRHTREWSERVDGADAFVFITPEYNFGMTAPLKNAIDYLFQEWQHKPVGFVSYGGIAAGTRAVQMLKQVVTSLKMVPLLESVMIPFVQRLFDDQGQFQPTEAMEATGRALLDELARWQEALAPLRTLGPQRPTSTR